MKRLQVLERGRSPQVEQIFAYTHVSGSPPVAPHKMSKTVLDADTLPELGAPSFGRDLLPESLLQRLILRDLDQPTVAGWALGTLQPQWTMVARLGCKFYHHSQSDRLYLIRWTM